MDKNQQSRYSKADLAILKKTYGDRNDIFLILRNHFLQLELSGEEVEYLSKIDKDFLDVLGKAIYFEPIPDVPLTQQATMYSGLNMLEQLHPEMGILLIESADLVSDYVKQQLNAITGEEEVIKLKDLTKRYGSIDQKEMRVVNTIAYNKIIPVVEGKLALLESWCTAKEETPEEKAKRLTANSNK